MSTVRNMPGGWADRESLPKGPNGRSLCRWCNLEVPKGRQTFCSDWCVEEWRLRTDSGYLREKVLARDRGICAECGVDCLAAWLHLKRLRGAPRLKAYKEWGITRSRKSLWDADHILAVAEGGGECDLSNLRTLCLKCHRTRHKIRDKNRGHDAQASEQFKNRGHDGQASEQFQPLK